MANTSIYNAFERMWSHTVDEITEKTSSLQTEIDSKASISHTHTKSQITDFPTSLKNPNSLTIQGNGTTLTNGTYDGSTAKTINITPSSIGAAVSSHTHSISNVTNLQSTLDGKAASDHNHNYAGSSSAGGAATSADKINTDAGSATNPVYFSNGIPVKTTYTLSKSVPSNAVFTDTHYASKNVVGSSTATSNTTSALTNGNVYLNSVENGAVTSTHKISGSGATTVTTDTSGNIIISSTDNNTVYTHPSYTARTGKPIANQTPGFGETATVSQITSDATGHVTTATDRTITIPSTLSNGTGTAGLIKTTSTVTSNSGYTACPVISGVPYYKDTKNTYTLSSFGVTATADELNALDGITATVTELNYCDGVTSNIQTQLNGKAASSHGNHVPATETANNAKFLRNDNTWATVTPANIGAAAASHGTHVSYGTSASALGTSSAGSASTVSRSDHVHALPALTSCTGTLSVAKGGTGATTAAAALTNLGIFDAIYPVGSIYMSVNNTNPGTLFGGTWEAWGSGRVPVGVNADDTSFATVEQTGGEKDHALTIDELAVHEHSVPAHAHGLNNHTHSIPKLSGTAASKTLTGKFGNFVVQSGSGKFTASGICSIAEISSDSMVSYFNENNVSGDVSDFCKIDATHSHTVTTTASTTGAASGNTADSSELVTGDVGLDNAHNNLQPYITCYMWKRTA